jgi:hypothetical protein
MRSLLLIYMAPAIAQPATAQCDGALQANTRVIAEREPVVSARDFSLDQIAGPAKRSGTARDSVGRGATTRTEGEHWVTPAVDQRRQPFHDARVAARRAVDTPGETRRRSYACGRDA